MKFWKKAALLIAVSVSVSASVSVPLSAAVSAPASVDFKEQVRQYVSIAEAPATPEQALKRAVLQRRIRESVFQFPGSREYVEKIRHIDSQATAHPGAAYDLARGLQLHWESRYWLKLSSTRFETARTGTALGAVAGLSLLGVSVLKNPVHAPKYFRILRHLLPVSMAGAGLTAGVATAQTETWLNGAPPSPAHLMDLGIPQTHMPYLNQDALVRDLLALSISAGAVGLGAEAYAFVRALKWVNAAATPAKTHPVVLAVSFLAMIVVEPAAQAGIDHVETSRMREAIRQAALEVQESQLSRNGMRLYLSANLLTENVLKYSRHLNRPLLESLQNRLETQEDLDRLLQEHGARRREVLRPLALRFEAGQLRMSRAQDRALAWEILQGDIASNSEHLLLQAAALLRLSRNEAVAEKTDLLMAAFHRDVALWRDTSLWTTPAKGGNPR